MAVDSVSGVSRVAIKSSAPLEQLAATVGEVLGVRFEPHDSVNWGDPYFLATGADGAEVRLTLNADPAYREGVDPPADRYFLSDHTDAPAVLWTETPIEPVIARIEVELGAECVIVSEP